MIAKVPKLLALHSTFSIVAGLQAKYNASLPLPHTISKRQKPQPHPDAEAAHVALLHIKEEVEAAKADQAQIEQVSPAEPCLSVAHGLPTD